MKEGIGSYLRVCTFFLQTKMISKTYLIEKEEVTF